MPKVRLNYDGWLALPMAVRKRLGLSAGQQLELELVGGAIVLRPTSSVSAADPIPPEPAPLAEQPKAAAAEPIPSVSSMPTVKRGPGRPRKTPVAAASPSEAIPPEPEAPAPLPAAPVKRGPGRPRKVQTAAIALPPNLRTRGRRATRQATE
jgi:bifunctional DNA-binding transcriptional regulator/antitoxin component of YhaV-PrlF toxin-antitoxin module